MAQADLGRYAGQFVWLALNFDDPKNHEFFMKYGAIGTPTFYVIAPDGGVRATQAGAMSLTELTQFLDRGAHAAARPAQTPADAALTRGDRLLAQQPQEAVKAYEQALRVAPPSWPRRELAEASLAVALQTAGRWQQCAETAAKEASEMRRDAAFGRTVVAGMWCVVSGNRAPWTAPAAAKLEPLAKIALSQSSTVRDHRDELYRTLMRLCLARGDNACAAGWGNRWLDELDGRTFTNDEERSAVDIARVENIQTYGDPKRILPALIASEKAMPGNWNASLRVAQMESAAKNENAVIAACERGLARQPGAVGRMWLLQVKAEALDDKGRRTEARAALQEALRSAQAIPDPQNREHAVKRLEAALR